VEKIIDRTIVKFGFYGFFKNLRFFEPFIYLYLLAVGLTFFEIGLIIAIREFTTYIFEIPTGVIADVWGRKKAILSCFVLYIISFILYYFSHSFLLVALASIMFGLGDAFRVGSHKAIIFDYLDSKGIGDWKAEVYGFTRSVALIGSALSAIIAAGLLIWSGSYHLIFLFSIIPYLLAFLLVLTYPPESGAGKDELKLSIIIAHTKKSLQNLRQVKDLRLSFVNSAVFDGVFEATRDYIQPVIRHFLIAYPILVMIQDGHMRETLLISFFYLAINLLGAFSSRWAHNLNRIFPSANLPLNYLFLTQAVMLLGIGFFIELNLPAVFILLLLLYIIKNLRRPLLLSYLTDFIEDEQRATMLSIESQLKSLAIIILAPALGLIADLYSIRFMFIAVSGLLFILYLGFLRFETTKIKDFSGSV